MRADSPQRDGRPEGPFNPHGPRRLDEPVERDSADRRERAYQDHLNELAVARAVKAAYAAGVRDGCAASARLGEELEGSVRKACGEGQG